MQKQLDTRDERCGDGVKIDWETVSMRHPLESIQRSVNIREELKFCVFFETCPGGGHLHRAANQVYLRPHPNSSINLQKCFKRLRHSRAGHLKGLRFLFTAEPVVPCSFKTDFLGSLFKLILQAIIKNKANRFF